MEKAPPTSSWSGSPELDAAYQQMLARDWYDDGPSNRDRRIGGTTRREDLVSSTRPETFVSRTAATMVHVGEAFPFEDLCCGSFKSLFTYRMNIIEGLAAANMTFTAFTHLLAAMSWVKNRRRLINGFLYLRQQHQGVLGALYDSILTYLQNYTCATVKEQRPGVVCTMKIPESFPELTALAFVRGTKDMSAELLVTRPWMASIDLANEARELNREACLIHWQNAHRVTELPNDMEWRFAEVYKSAERDQVRLVDMNGAALGPKLTMEEIEEFIRKVKGTS